ncbi:hypothetical protein M514_09076 [Trichuris suis]|uniref:Uncharacterized protein n=1 Tax=Trichuris suis TaxID=68888 RepID=A0A085MSG0_9BILA|nr:hypothetical protein M514_09076 [Trichuris suis]
MCCISVVRAIISLRENQVAAMPCFSIVAVQRLWLYLMHRPSVPVYNWGASNNIFIDRVPFISFSNANTEEDEVAEMLNTLKHFSISDRCNMTDMNMWLACDEDAGFQMLNDDEIVETVSNLHGEPDEREEEEFYDDEMLVNVCPSHKKAYQCLEIALQWIEMQECDSKKCL